MDKLTREEVLHVAHLARIAVSEEDILKYQYELKALIDEIDKIRLVKNYDEDLLIAPWKSDATLRDDVKGEELTFDDIMKNVPSSSGNFVEVPVVISE